MNVKAEYDPKVDIAFKKIFGVERNKPLLISLINSILEPKDHVKDITVINPYNEKEFETDKLSILDIKAKDLNGKRFNIEMQVTDANDYDKRALFYWAKTYVEQLQEAGKYTDLQKTIGIHFLNFPCIKNAKEFHNIFALREIKNNNKDIYIFKNMEIHTLELGKFFSKNTQDEVDMESLKNSINLWMTFLTKRKMLSDKDLSNLPEGLMVKRAIKEAEYMVMTEAERAMYDQHQKFLRDEASAIDAAVRKTKEKLVQAEQKAEAERQRADRLQRQLEQVLQSVEKNKQKEIGASIDKDPTGNNTKKGE